MYIQYKNIKYPLSNLSTRKETINDNIGYKKKSKKSQRYVKKTSKITTSKKRSIRPAIKGKGDGVRAGQAPNIVFQQKIPLFPMMKHRLNRSRPTLFSKSFSVHLSLKNSPGGIQSSAPLSAFIFPRSFSISNVQLIAYF